MIHDTDFLQQLNVGLLPFRVRLLPPSIIAAADNRKVRNYLNDINGDKANAILAACGFNLRKLLRAFFWLVFKELDRLKLRLKPLKMFIAPTTERVCKLNVGTILQI